MCVIKRHNTSYRIINSLWINIQLINGFFTYIIFIWGLFKYAGCKLNLGKGIRRIKRDKGDIQFGVYHLACVHKAGAVP